ncbi:hypothetical protein EEL35_04020 [Muribaculaceae bacterium Isolate-042 (Harlan)]|nr:hypothetical protein EEL35_04020 [Muribaculaceae bacterium Isolate-042 (Harlan)]
MMFFKKLFVCCYRFQIRVGNGDMPVSMSMGMILFAIYLYITSISIGVSFYWQNVIGNQSAIGLKTLSFCNILICCLVGTMLYLKYMKGDRLNQTLSIEVSKYDKVKAILFIIGSITSLCCIFIYMWAVNNGFIIKGGMQ